MNFKVGDLVCIESSTPTDGPTNDRIYEVTAARPVRLDRGGEGQALTLRIVLLEITAEDESDLGCLRYESSEGLARVPEMLFVARVARGDPHVMPQFQADAE